MDIENGIKEYHLKTPIQVHFKGEGDKEVSLLTMHEPRREHLRWSAKMRQALTRATIEMGERNKENIPVAGEEVREFHEITSEEHAKNAEEMMQGISVCLLLSETVQLDVFVDNFIKMATKPAKKNIIMCDDAIPIKEHHFEQMSDSEVMDIAFTYASFFLMPSVMQDN